ncbi:MAG: hypothetical protein NTW20_08170 [Rhodobacterales bacterium]|nr:hypothetical protein [Rhodobacterales bacterium]
MATGAGTAGLLKLAAMLVGGFSIWRSNRARRRGETSTEDDELAQRLAARAETERRMAAYLAQRNAAAKATEDDEHEREIRR